MGLPAWQPRGWSGSRWEPSLPETGRLAGVALGQAGCWQEWAAVLSW